MAATTVEPITTARIAPSSYLRSHDIQLGRRALLVALGLILLCGFGFRVVNLSVDGLSEDELNKLRAVAEYRRYGLTPANGEHPMLMKGLLTVSVIVAERWNESSLAAGRADFQIPVESALRFPGALFGAFTALLIFLVTRELFGARAGLIAAGLWAFDPAAIGFNRIAKEDTFLVFFFMLGNAFWLCSQRLAEIGRKRPEPYYWAAAASFGAMTASKYVPHFLAISTSYYYAFQGVPSARWRLGKNKWLIFLAVMALTFLICNPTILLPGTWREMSTFASEKRIGHDAYEFMGQLYRNQLTLWLRGSPWYFYYTFVALKLPLIVVVGLVCALPLVWRRKFGDGRYLLFFWAVFWLMPFTVMGGKFTRYFTFALPIVLIIAALGLNHLVGLAARLFARTFSGGLGDGRGESRRLVEIAVILVFLADPLYAAGTVSPYYRLYVNILGGGTAQAGNYFPHDEFYDGSVRAAAEKVALVAPPGARVASETPELLGFYAERAQRKDLAQISLSDKMSLGKLRPGDLVVAARGRKYFSNERTIMILRSLLKPVQRVEYGPTTSVEIYSLDARTLSALNAAGN